jgi:DNA uptake protein ComE-like DNA-binding protein
MRERRGLAILLSILIIQLLFLGFLNNVDLEYPSPDPATVARLRAEIEKDQKVFSTHEISLPAGLKKFNPNDISKSEWMDFGLSEKQAGSVVNYLHKGGRFRIRNDIKKVYGMNDRLFASLFSFIDLPDTFVSFHKKEFQQRAERFIPDLNSADSTQLEKLRGIGVKLASRIVRYRERLGGFTELSQLKEVWGLNDTLYHLITEQVRLQNDFQVRQLRLNTDSFRVFSAHPYIGYKLAGLIMNYRQQHSGFSNTSELKNLPLLTDENFRKLAPYLKTD